MGSWGPGSSPTSARCSAIRARRWPSEGAILSSVTDLDRLLDFAARSRLPGGGFGYLRDDGTGDAARCQETWIVARMTHVFGLAQLLGRPGAAELVRHGVAALTGGPLRDRRHGGW